jgi:hypothetical protein
MKKVSKSDPRWKRLVKIEPLLVELLKEVEAIRDDRTKPSFCANRLWYGRGPNGEESIRTRMEELVGWDCPTPELQNHIDHAVAYGVLYNLLPDCRNCGEPSFGNP